MPPRRLGQDRAVWRPRHPFPKGSGILFGRWVAPTLPVVPQGGPKPTARTYFAAADAKSTAIPGPIVEDNEIFFK